MPQQSKSSFKDATQQYKEPTFIFRLFKFYTE